ncbi:MAG TPA: DNA mismatch repair endonuclease MutL [Polyangia bacterium]|jgi:DNA mismatch repair protein MutL|nr:DNA mismatch repair endonuclease MutL [Polyangia bacterium]
MNTAESSQQKIRILPSTLADQIAAGEVVERPASVVKELVENAIDAGARRVEVEIESGGRRLIRVVDDGCGMIPDDARLALKRHATSKISAAEDLWGLRTFGFRGEALPSIAAVARLTLASKTAGGAAGFRLVVEGGVEVDAREAGIPDGTQVEVRDLFFNTPARQKFQKSEATEAANVSEAMLRLALAHPEVHFRLRAGGRVALDLPVHRELGERVRAALARRGASVLHEAQGDEGGHLVRAFLAGPDEASTTPRSTFLFVGGRFVRDRSLLHALAFGYGALLEKGRYPLATLFIEVPGQELDVNVHPQKLEVRFARPQEVYAAVRHVVGAAIARAPWLAETTGRAVRVFTHPPREWAGASDDQERATAAISGVGVALPRTAQTGLPLRAQAPRARPGSLRDAPAGTRAFDLGYGSGARPAEARSLDADGGSGAATAVEPDPGTAADGREPFFATLNYVGQLDRTYLVCEGPGEMILIDQHAAHERIAFARLRAAHGRREIRRQRLLFPIPVELDELAAALASDATLLEPFGFELTLDSPTAAADGDDATPSRAVRLQVRAVPEMLKDADPKPLLRDVLGQLADSGVATSALERIDHVLATMACHSVVRAGDVLGREQVQGLLAQLDGVDLRSHCPHGRPVLLRMALTEIERRFGRI